MFDIELYLHIGPFTHRQHSSQNKAVVCADGRVQLSFPERVRVPVHWNIETIRQNSTIFQDTLKRSGFLVSNRENSTPNFKIYLRKKASMEKKLGHFKVLRLSSRYLLILAI